MQSPSVADRCIRSFPSKAIQQKRTKLDDLQQQLQATQDKHKACHKQLEQALGARQHTKERKLKLDRLSTLRNKKRALDEEMKQYEVCDPERLKKLKAGVVVCRDSANRWTENCQLIIQYWRKKGIEIDAGVSDTTHSTTHAMPLPPARLVFELTSMCDMRCASCACWLGDIPARWVAEGYGCAGVRTVSVLLWQHESSRLRQVRTASTVSTSCPLYDRCLSHQYSPSLDAPQQ